MPNEWISSSLTLPILSPGTYFFLGIYLFLSCSIAKSCYCRHCSLFFLLFHCLGLKQSFFHLTVLFSLLCSPYIHGVRLCRQNKYHFIFSENGSFKYTILHEILTFRQWSSDTHLHASYISKVKSCFLFSKYFLYEPVKGWWRKYLKCKLVKQEKAIKIILDAYRSPWF